MTQDSTSTAVGSPELLTLAFVREERRPAGATSSKGLSRFPAWLRFVDSLHRADRSPFVICADIAVSAGCAIVAGTGLVPAIGLACAMAFLLYIGTGYADRGPLETQGVLWFASRALPAVAFTTLIGVSVAHVAGWDTAVALRFGWSAAAGVVSMRAVSWSILATARRRGLGLRRTLIVGHSADASMLAHKLVDYSEAGLLPVAMHPLGNGHGFARFMPEFPSAEQLSRSIEDASVEHVVLAPDGGEEAILECVRGSSGLDVTFSMLPPLAEFFLHPGHVSQVGGIPLIPLGRLAKGPATQPGKRLFDVVVATLVLFFLSPLMIAAALAIRVFDRGPVFYRQQRVGYGGRVFKMLKFRSMVVGAERLVVDLRDRNVNNGLLFKITDDPRITRVGRIMRRLSIDELPQLWNVIKGEMSLVGPRPLPVEPTDFGPLDHRRHSVLPGITGYWQIAGAHGLSYEEMIRLDLAYIQNGSLWTDIRILLRTIPALVHRRGPF